MFLAEMVYDVSANIILDSCVRAVSDWDVITSMIKSWVFGTIISVVRATARGGSTVVPTCMQWLAALAAWGVALASPEHAAHLLDAFWCLQGLR